MSGAKAFARPVFAIACWGLVFCGAPDGSRAAALAAFSIPDPAEPAGDRRDGRYGGLLHDVQSHALSVIVDDPTGIRAGIPMGIVGAPSVGKSGRNWKAYDNRINIDTLRFFDRSL